MTARVTLTGLLIYCLAATALGQGKPHSVTAHTTVDDKWSHLILSGWDLYAINRDNSKGRTEIHALSGTGDYKTFIKHDESALHATDSNWVFVEAHPRGENGPLPGGPHIAAINMKGTNGKTTIHILKGPNYNQKVFETETALPHTNSNWSFGFDYSNNLWAIDRQGLTTNSTEVHILDAKKGYKQFLRYQQRTALHKTDGEWYFEVEDSALIAMRYNVKKHELERHVMLEKDFGTFTHHSRTEAYIEKPSEWEIHSGPSSGWFAIHKLNTPSRMTEIYYYPGTVARAPDTPRKCICADGSGNTLTRLPEKICKANNDCANPCGSWARGQSEYTLRNGMQTFCRAY